MRWPLREVKMRLHLKENSPLNDSHLDLYDQHPISSSVRDLFCIDDLVLISYVDTNGVYFFQ